MSWLRLFRSVALVTALLATSACIPVTVRKERVEPTLTMSAVEPDWNPFLSPDACLEATRDFRRVLGKIRKGVEYVEPEILWREVLRPEQTSPDQRARVLLDGLNAGGAARLKLRGLIILGRRTYHQDDADTQPLSVFYESLSQETVWQAVVLGWGGADSLPRQVMSTAKGIERDGWFPGYVLLFARLQKEVDTDGGSMRGLIKALFDTMPSEEAGVPTRIAVLAEATCGVPGR
jgi:hypothetical protein